MTNLQIFQNSDFGEIRTLTIKGEPWFVGKDVAEALGYKDTVNALKAHIDDEDKRGWQITTPSGEQQMTIINESGLYSLVLSSKLPTAKKFKRWITAEVIPSIRKHGAYITPETLQAALLNPDTLIHLCQQLKAEQVQNQQLRIQNSELVVKTQIMQPKADFFDDCVDRNLLTSFRETAKELDIKEKVFIKFLLEKKYIYRDKKGQLKPYAGREDLFEIKESKNDKTGWTGTQTLVTPKGRETFRLLCKGM